MNVNYAPDKQEITGRIEKLHKLALARLADWDALLLFGKINQYYLTGTMQDGVFALRRDGAYAYFVRRSMERAQEESLISELRPMASYRDLADFLGNGEPAVALEADLVTHTVLERLRRTLNLRKIIPADGVLARLRAVKSAYELGWIREAGALHAHIFESIVPGLLREGISEADLMAELLCAMVKLGHQGIARFAMFQSEIFGGQIGFGENSLAPCCFDGPGGMRGMSPAVPSLGNRTRTLQKGDLVFLDFAYGCNGYHTDRTQLYLYGAQPSDELQAAHAECLQTQKEVASRLKPGVIPSEIYSAVTAGGFRNRNVKFLGHGVGLHVDEYPVIALGFEEPLEENMTLAVEPKKGVPGVGLAGVEDTYLVTPQGGRCLTGGEREIMVI